MKRVAVLIVVLMSGALAFPQGPTPPNPADHVQHQVKFLTTLLSLNAAQQQQAKKIFARSASNETAIHNNLKTAHESLRTAVKNNDSAGIEEASSTIGQLTAQLESDHAKADAAFNQILTPDQQSKLSEFESQGPGPFHGGEPQP